MQIIKGNTTEGKATRSLSLFFALGSLAVGLLAGILRDGYRRFKPLERPEAVRDNASRQSMHTLYEKT